MPEISWFFGIIIRMFMEAGATWPGAREFKRALELNPAIAEAHQR